MDAALYDLAPPKVTALYGLKVPKGPNQTVRYDDGTGDELAVTLGTTARARRCSRYFQKSSRASLYELGQGMHHTHFNGCAMPEHSPLD